ncbi:MAG: 2OG-Fe(II) oxygenase [Gammaproteobacteria bacterium]
MNLYKYPDLYSYQIEQAEQLNHKLYQGFLSHVDDGDIRRSHHFGGRYENIYIDSEKIPELDTILHQAIACASEILNKPVTKLKAGLWFNAMGKGQVTTAHRHDDDDELLSAVYYIRTPQNSGQLILSDQNLRAEITPKAGLFMFFPPDMMHEVTVNNSEEMRLSLGINIGPK